MVPSWPFVPTTVEVAATPPAAPPPAGVRFPTPPSPPSPLNTTGGHALVETFLPPLPPEARHVVALKVEAPPSPPSVQLAGLEACSAPRVPPRPTTIGTEFGRADNSPWTRWNPPPPPAPP